MEKTSDNTPFDASLNIATSNESLPFAEPQTTGAMRAREPAVEKVSSKTRSPKTMAKRSPVIRVKGKASEKAPVRPVAADAQIPDNPASAMPDMAGDTEGTAELTNLVAFYLPQFHPIPENDKAWGKGFTEWTNVTKAKELFPGHNQPRYPSEQGYYDLRLPEVMQEQASLAKLHGVHGFCYYYYWFDGYRVLEKPLEIMLANPQIDMPFCLCWANENWSRRWDGSENEIIIEQKYGEKTVTDFVDDLLPYINDRRYIRVNGKPLLLVYRPDIIPDLPGTLKAWRKKAKAHGHELYIAGCLTFGFNDPLAVGFDGAVEFPPHGVQASAVTEEIEWHGEFEGNAYSYAEAVANELSKPEPPFPVFRTAMAGWDNTPRRGVKGHIFHGATPELFESWLSALVLRSQHVQSPGQRFVFINAWNEWAEGAHLEPDQKFGRQWLMACSRAVNAVTLPCGDAVEDNLIARFEKHALSENAEPYMRAILEIFRAKDERLKSAVAVNNALSDIYLNGLKTQKFSRAHKMVPNATLNSAWRFGNGLATGWIDHPYTESSIVCRDEKPLLVSGWICPTEPSEEELRCVITVMPHNSGEPLSTIATYGMNRFDVAQSSHYLPQQHAALSGFEAYLDLRTLEPGDYTVMIGLLSPSNVRYMQKSFNIFLS